MRRVTQSSLGARFEAAVIAGHADQLAVLACVAGVGLRVWATSPFLALVADDRTAPLDERDLEVFERAAAALLGAPGRRVTALTSLAPERRAAAWERATRLASSGVAALADGGAANGPASAAVREVPHASYEVETTSGSTYRFRHDVVDGRWWVCADNVPNADSRSLADGEWEVGEPWPWPPVVGLPLDFGPPAGTDPASPSRVPGGGKITSAVRRVRRVAPASAAAAPVCGGVPSQEDVA